MHYDFLTDKAGKVYICQSGCDLPEEIGFVKLPCNVKPKSLAIALESFCKSVVFMLHFYPENYQVLADVCRWFFQLVVQECKLELTEDNLITIIEQCGLDTPTCLQIAKEIQK